MNMDLRWICDMVCIPQDCEKSTRLDLKINKDKQTDCLTLAFLVKANATYFRYICLRIVYVIGFHGMPF